MKAVQAMRLIIIDNYDSFTYNLFQLFSTFDIEVQVFRNDEVSVDEIMGMDFNWLCISPGPKGPKDTGISPILIKKLHRDVPILGVCLGMQVINEVFGGDTCLAPYPMHGKKDLVSHNDGEIFRGIPSPFQVARYHSLQCDPVAPCLKVTAKSVTDNVVMGIAHPKYPIYGVQFHPESFMCEYGREIIENFLSVT